MEKMIQLARLGAAVMWAAAATLALRREWQHRPLAGAELRVAAADAANAALGRVRASMAADQADGALPLWPDDADLCTAPVPGVRRGW